MKLSYQPFDSFKYYKTVVLYTIILLLGNLTILLLLVTFYPFLFYSLFILLWEICSTNQENDLHDHYYNIFTGSC